MTTSKLAPLICTRRRNTQREISWSSRGGLSRTGSRQPRAAAEGRLVPDRGGRIPGLGAFAARCSTMLLKDYPAAAPPQHAADAEALVGEPSQATGRQAH